MSSPWRSLEEVCGLSAVLVEWKQHTGPAFDAFKKGFLKKAGRDALSYPCPQKSGCSHKVLPRGLGFVGVCKDDDGSDCDDIVLKKEDVEVWTFDFIRLGRAIAWAFESEDKFWNLQMPETIQIAAFSSAAIPVMLTLPQNRDEFQQAVTTLVARSNRPFILIGPTNRFMDRRSQELLDRVNAEFYDLATQVEIEADGSLKARTPARELFARFLAGSPATGGGGREQPAKQNSFGKAGSHWDVTFDGGMTFHIPDTLGAEYLNHLLHHPSEAISAYDLEMKIRPDKAKARPKDSVQNNLDAETIRQYLRQLEKMRGQREKASDDGDVARVDQLDEEMEAIGNELKKNGQAPDAGERSRGNVGKAVAAVQRKLQKGGDNEKAFAKHIEQFVSMGYECSYNQPQGNRWG